MSFFITLSLYVICYVLLFFVSVIVVNICGALNVRYYSTSFKILPNSILTLGLA